MQNQLDHITITMDATTPSTSKPTASVVSGSSGPAATPSSSSSVSRRRSSATRPRKSVTELASRRSKRPVRRRVTIPYEDERDEVEELVDSDYEPTVPLPGEDDDDNLNLEDIFDDEEDDDEPILLRRRSSSSASASAGQKRPRPVLDHVPVPPTAAPDQEWEEARSNAVRLNIAHVEMLIRLYDHKKGIPSYSAEDNNAKSAQLKEIQGQIDAVYEAIKAWGLPVQRKNDPVEEIREADGTEYRFTTVANMLGIKWSSVPDAHKRRVYERAADLHEQVFGSRPPRVKVWTKDGRSAVYYYSMATYGATMERALREYSWQPDARGI